VFALLYFDKNNRKETVIRYPKVPGGEHVRSTYCHIP
jgi:hypothetical protein